MDESFIQSLQNDVFQKENERLHDFGISQTILGTENVLLKFWPVGAPDHSSIENI